MDNNRSEDDILDEFDDMSDISNEALDSFENDGFDEDFPDSFDESDLGNLF